MGYTIHKAKDDGYYVLGAPEETARWADILFAGSLGECLQYVWNAFGMKGTLSE